MYWVSTKIMSWMLDTTRDTDLKLVLEHHSIHVTHTVSFITGIQHITASSAIFLWTQCIPVCTEYVLSTYLCVIVHTHTDPTHTAFSIRNHHNFNPHESPSVTSLLPTLVWPFASRILPVQSLLNCQAAQARLLTIHGSKCKWDRPWFGLDSISPAIRCI